MTWNELAGRLRRLGRTSERGEGELMLTCPCKNGDEPLDVTVRGEVLQGFGWVHVTALGGQRAVVPLATLRGEVFDLIVITLLEQASAIRRMAGEAAHPFADLYSV